MNSQLFGSNLNSKLQDNIDQSLFRSQQRVHVQGMINSYKSPKAKIILDPQTMSETTLDKQQIKPIQGMKLIDEPLVNRQESYQMPKEADIMKSAIKGQTHLLNYDLDQENGITSTPMVYTFNYENLLQHDLKHYLHEEDNAHFDWNK